MTRIENQQVTSLIDALTTRSRIQGIPAEHDASCLASYLTGLIGAMANDMPVVQEYLAHRERVVRNDIARIVDITREFQ